MLNWPKRKDGGGADRLCSAVRSGFLRLAGPSDGHFPPLKGSEVWALGLHRGM